MIEPLISANLLLAYSLYAVGVASPGPSNLAIMATAMNTGRKPALILALGVICGSLFWGLLAAFGLTALLATYSHLLIIMKLVGGCYLLWLAYRSARSAISMSSPSGSVLAQIESNDINIFLRGACIHLTNPKAIFVWLSIVTLSMPTYSPAAGALTGATQAGDALIVVLGCGVLGAVVFGSYALLFSTARARRIYVKLRRWFEGVLALLFGYAGYRVLTSKLQLGEQ
jgi:threonine efflux protein